MDSKIRSICHEIDSEYLFFHNSVYSFEFRMPAFGREAKGHLEIPVLHFQNLNMTDCQYFDDSNIQGILDQSILWQDADR